MSVADLVSRGIDPQALQRAVRTGEAVRLRRGVYYSGSDWARLSVDERYRHLVVAVATSRRVPHVVSHLSAAALWGIPTVGAWPTTVHFTSPAASGGRSSPGIVRHFSDVQAQQVSGIPVTSVARTVVDTAADASFLKAVVAADHVLRDALQDRPMFGVSARDVRAEWEAALPFPNFRRAERPLEFSTGLSGSVGESVCRVQFDELSYPAPILQRRFVDRHGRDIFTDFYFEEYNAAAEFDGRGKYERVELLNGETPADRLWKEKQREDDLRTQVDGVARLIWEDLRSPQALIVRLADAGIYPTRRPLARRAR